MKPKKLNKFFKALLEEVRLSEESLDSQIDSLLLGYRSTSTLEEAKKNNRKLSKFSAILMEQPGDEEEEQVLPGEETRPEEVVGDEQSASDEEVEPRAPRIDLDLYCQKVSTLLDNYSKLLDVMPVLINRAKNVLREMYTEDVIEEFEDILDREFGVSLEDREEGEEYPEVPLGGNAGYPPPG